MTFIDFIIYDFISFIIKFLFIFVIYKLFIKKKKNDFFTQFDFGNSDNSKSILDISSPFDNSDNLDSSDFVNEEKL